MNPQDKASVIVSIVNRLADANKRKNKELAHQNLCSEQKPFDTFGTWLSLASMPDKDLLKIAGINL